MGVIFYARIVSSTRAFKQINADAIIDFSTDVFKRASVGATARPSADAVSQAMAPPPRVLLRAQSSWRLW